MRRSAYIKCLELAYDLLPEAIPEFMTYFKNSYNPRLHAINEIKRAARLDDELLDIELVDILNWKTPQEVIHHVY